MTTKKSISKYCLELLPLLFVAGICLVLFRSLQSERGPAPRDVTAADRKQEMVDELQSPNSLKAREVMGRVPPDAGWIELADKENLAALEPKRLWLQRLDEPLAVPISIAVREPLSHDQLVASRVFAWVPGYTPFSGQLTPRSGPNALLLNRAGSLQVRIVDVAGRPVDDCEVSLFLDDGDDELRLAEGHSIFSNEPVDTSRELIDTPRGWVQSQHAVDTAAWPTGFEQSDWNASARRTSVDGLATWTDLPPREGYRWFVAPPLHAQVDPPHERKRLVEVSDYVQSSSPPPLGLSGRFDITAGQTLQLEGTLLAPAIVRGRVHCPLAATAAVIKLYSVDRAGGTTAPQTTAFDEAQSQLCASDGAFQFPDLRPGIWAVRAWWTEGELDYYYTCETFKLEPGADLDLGVLRALEGQTLEVAIGIADQDGVAQAPEAIYSSPRDRLDAHLTITVMPDSGLATHMVSGYFPVPFGEIFRIHGVQPGRAHVGAEPSPGLSVDPSRVGSIVGTHPSGFTVGSTDFVYLELRARMGTARRLLMRNDRGVEITAPAVWVRDLGSNRVSSVRPNRLGSSAASGEAPSAERRQSLNLPDGSYELVCKYTTKTNPNGFVARASAIFDGTDSGPIELDAQPAVSVSGVLRDNSGAAIPNQSLYWRLEGWELDSDNAIFGATTDEHGAFVLNEVPAHTALRCSSLGCDLPPLAPGIHRGLVLTTTP
jgi:hypothetical protein